MIYNISGRTDLIAFYYPWLINRFKEGYVDVRQPFDYHRVLRYRLDKDAIDALFICTKNPLPILANPEPLLAFDTIIQVTITPYGADIEPFVPKKKKVIEAVKELAKIFGSDHIYVRYDPILVNEKYTLDQHIASFRNLVEMLKGDVYAFIISFVDEYKNTVKHGISSLSLKEILYLGEAFGEIARNNGVTVQTCAEIVSLNQFGIIHGLCLDPDYLTKVTKKNIAWEIDADKRKNCACVAYRDIGAYNTCLHFCKYCYANFDEAEIINNYKQHDPLSSMLIGHLEKDDKIYEVPLKARQYKLF